MSTSTEETRTYKIEIDINSTKEKVWNVLTDFQNYPKWNSVLTLENNDNLLVEKKFDVQITQPNKKTSSFKAKVIRKNNFQSFTAVQRIIGKWFFQATHHFILTETDNKHVIFIQKWELTGIMSVLFRKLIFNELDVFNRMNSELKAYVEK